jgi:hypothetical protein
MKKALVLTLALGVALPAIAQESTTQSSSAKVAKAPAKPVSPPKKPSSTAGGTTKGKAAQVPSHVSAGSPSAAAEKREARTADGPASAENSIDVSKKSQAKKKKTTGTQPEGKDKPQS